MYMPSALKGADQHFEMLKTSANIVYSDNKVSNKLFKTILALNVEKRSIESQ